MRRVQRGPEVALCLVLIYLLPGIDGQEQQVAATSDSRIQYSASWTLTEGKASHITQTTGATATFTFDGPYIAFRSTRSVTQGVEKITLDGQDYVVNCSWPDASVAGDTVVVFEKSGMETGDHAVTFTKTSAQGLYAVVWDFIYIPASELTTSSSAAYSSSVSAAMAISTLQNATVPLPAASQSSSSPSTVTDPGYSQGGLSNPCVFSAILLSCLIRRVPRDSVSTSFSYQSVAAKGRDPASLSTIASTPFHAENKDESSLTGVTSAVSAIVVSNTRWLAESAATDASRSSSGLSKGTLGAIIGAAALLFLLLALIAWFVIRRRRARSAPLHLHTEAHGPDYSEKFDDAPLSSGAELTPRARYPTYGAAGPQAMPAEETETHSVRSLGATSTLMSWVPTPAQRYAAQTRSETSEAAFPNPSAVIEEREQPNVVFRTRPPTYVTSRTPRQPRNPNDLAVFIDDSTASMKQGGRPRGLGSKTGGKGISSCAE